MCPRDSQPGGRDCPRQDRDRGRTRTPWPQPQEPPARWERAATATSPLGTGSQRPRHPGVPTIPSLCSAGSGSRVGHHTGWSPCPTLSPPPCPELQVPALAGRSGARDSLPGRERQGRCRGLWQTCKGRGAGRGGSSASPGSAGWGCGAQDPRPRSWSGAGHTEDTGSRHGSDGAGAGRDPRPLQREESLPVPPPGHGPVPPGRLEEGPLLLSLSPGLGPSLALPLLPAGPAAAPGIAAAPAALTRPTGSSGCGRSIAGPAARPGRRNCKLALSSSGRRKLSHPPSWGPPWWASPG